MTKIKKFESFNDRVPKQVNHDEWIKKWEIHGYDTFTQKEVDFFRKLVEENSRYVSLHHIYKNEVSLSISDDDIVNGINEYMTTNIYKLKDDWYLILKKYDDFDEEQYQDSKFFICDEWDEILGYLESIDLKI